MTKELPEPLYLKYGARVAADKPSRHRQAAADALMICPKCRENDCMACPDRLLLLVGRDPVCTCKRNGHEDAISGEPRRVQVTDPMTGDIYGPGGRVAEGSLEQSPEADSDR